MNTSDEPNRSPSWQQELGLLPRFYSAISFMVAAFVPVAVFFMLLGGIFWRTAQMPFEELWMFGVMPIATAAFFGFVSGVKILDPLSVSRGLQAVKRGLLVAFSSYAVFILLFFFVLVMASIAGGNNTREIAFTAPIVIFFYGLIFVGVPIALGGGLSGWLLFRFSRQPTSRARIAASPRLSRKQAQIWRAIAITALILSCSPAFLSLRRSNQAKLKEQIDLELIIAVRDGSPSRVQDLLSKGADVEAKDNAKGTPVLWAARGGRTEIVKILLERGANPNVVEHGNNNMTPLIWAAALDNLECVRMLLEHGADVNAFTTQGYTALMQAAQNGTPATVRVLLDHGADRSLVNGYQGQTALEIAKATRSVPSIVDVTAGQSFTDPVAITKAQKRHDEIIQILQVAGSKD
jgi:hypothetical protein